MAGMVFALAVLAASPVAHDCLHADDAPVSEDQCAVVLFAHGVSAPLSHVVVTAPISTGQTTLRAVATEVFVSRPRYLRQPERGPPALG